VCNFDDFLIFISLFDRSRSLLLWLKKVAKTFCKNLFFFNLKNISEFIEFFLYGNNINVEFLFHKRFNLFPEILLNFILLEEIGDSISFLIRTILKKQLGETF